MILPWRVVAFFPGILTHGLIMRVRITYIWLHGSWVGRYRLVSYFLVSLSPRYPQLPPCRGATRTKVRDYC